MAKFFAAVIGSLLFGFGVSAFVGVACVAYGEAGTDLAAWSGFFAILIGILVAGFAPTGGKAWRRVMILCSCTAFMLPIGGVIGGVSYMEENRTAMVLFDEVAAATWLGFIMSAGLLSIVGVLSGIVFLVIALLCGRDPQVVYLQQAPGAVYFPPVAAPAPPGPAPAPLGYVEPTRSPGMYAD